MLVMIVLARKFGEKTAAIAVVHRGGRRYVIRAISFRPVFRSHGIVVTHLDGNQSAGVQPRDSPYPPFSLPPATHDSNFSTDEFHRKRAVTQEVVNVFSKKFGNILISTL